MKAVALRFRRVDAHRKSYLPLLLLADPSEAMVDRYLEAGEMTVLEDGETGEVLAEAVMLPLGPEQIELKNLAVAENRQRQGFGSQMVRHLLAEYGSRYPEILVGTSPAGAPFYRRLGFADSHILPGFFSAYPEPVVEDGVVLTDMLMLVWRQRL